jgi:PPK2 family polyphosphate:nucleotide phosphotransferase
MDFPDLHRIKPNARVRLADIDPDSAPGFPSKKREKTAIKDEAAKQVASNLQRIAELQELLYAQNQTSMLVVLQGMDTSGKDGVVRGVFSGINPQGCHITSFKKPSEAEADRDFLWRIHAQVPARGEINVFNRAHYEDVLIVRVHNFVPENVWRKRYDMINQFEQYLTNNHVVIVKFMLHISKDEQKARLQARLDDPAKRWKFNPADVQERKHWDDYQRAYETVLEKCSTTHAPWYVIPANKKWYRNWAISTILRQSLEEIDPKAPKATFDPKAITIPD